MISVLMILVSAAFAATPSDGMYERSCYTVGEDTLRSSVQIQQNKWIQTHTAYEEDSCQTPYLIYQTEYRAQLGEPQVDLSVVEVSYKTPSQEVVEALNMINYCGFHNWKVNEKKVVTGVLCDEYQVPAKAEVLYSVFKVQKKSDQAVELYLGAPANAERGKTPATRHQGFEAEPYVLR